LFSLPRGDALRFASRLPLAFIFRAFGAPVSTFVQSLPKLKLGENEIGGGAEDSQVAARQLGENEIGGGAEDSQVAARFVPYVKTC
jgi:hypothetical protein